MYVALLKRATIHGGLPEAWDRGVAETARAQILVKRPSDAQILRNVIALGGQERGAAHARREQDEPCGEIMCLYDDHEPRERAERYRGSVISTASCPKIGFTFSSVFALAQIVKQFVVPLLA